MNVDEIVSDVFNYLNTSFMEYDESLFFNSEQTLINNISHLLKNKLRSKYKHLYDVDFIYELKVPNCRTRLDLVIIISEILSLDEESYHRFGYADIIDQSKPYTELPDDKIHRPIMIGLEFKNITSGRFAYFNTSTLLGTKVKIPYTESYENKENKEIIKGVEKDINSLLHFKELYKNDAHTFGFQVTLCDNKALGIDIKSKFKKLKMDIAHNKELTTNVYSKYTIYDLEKNNLKILKKIFKRETDQNISIKSLKDIHDLIIYFANSKFKKLDLYFLPTPELENRLKKHPKLDTDIFYELIDMYRKLREDNSYQRASVYLTTISLK